MVRRVLYTVFIRTYSLARVVHDHLRRQPTDNAFGDHGGSDMDPTAQVGHGNDGQPLVGTSMLSPNRGKHGGRRGQSIKNPGTSLAVRRHTMLYL